jgi:hypothetical protein
MAKSCSSTCPRIWVSARRERGSETIIGSKYEACPPHRPASRIEKAKANFSAGPIRRTAYGPTRHPPALKLKTHLKAASCARNFFLLQQRQTA